jgi:hypothetical protein
MSALVATTTLTPSNSSDPLFRAWGSAINVKLAAAGLVQTADTGQINWTTVTAPVGATTAQGYEIWRFADALQSTAPVFFKLEYGSGSATNNPGLWITFGSGSSGAGVLTGTTSVRQAFGSTASYTTNPLSCYWCGDTNRFVASLFAAGTGLSPSLTVVLSFERTVDSSGVVTSEGVLLLVKTGSGAYAQVHWNCTTGPTSSWETTVGAMGPQMGTGSSGSQLAVYPVFFTKGVFLNPGLNLFGYFNVDFTAGSTTSFTVYGASHTYMPVGSTAASAFLVRGTTTSCMQRYE